MCIKIPRIFLKAQFDNYEHNNNFNKQKLVLILGIDFGNLINIVYHRIKIQVSYLIKYMKEYISLLASQTVLTKQNMFFILAYHTLD